MARAHRTHVLYWPRRYVLRSPLSETEAKLALAAQIDTRAVGVGVPERPLSGVFADGRLMLHRSRQSRRDAGLAMVLGELRGDGVGSCVELRVWPTPLLTGLIFAAVGLLSLVGIRGLVGPSASAFSPVLLMFVGVAGAGALAAWLTMCAAEAERVVTILSAILQAPIQR